MNRYFTLAAIATIVFFGTAIQPVRASGGAIYTVRQGDSLPSIAAHHGLPVDELLSANNLSWGTWIYAGQQLVIPNQNRLPTGEASAQSAFAEVPQPGFDPTVDRPIVVPSDTLSGPFQPAEGLPIQGPQWTPWVGVEPVSRPQTASLSPSTNFSAAPQPVPVSAAEQISTSTSQLPDRPEKWIDIDLTTQTLTAYEGQTPVFNTTVSTGTSQYPTVVGTFDIYVKYEKARMRGGSGATAYDLPDVPFVMYFHKGYGLHGTYWHDNFGTPMSHGCVNLSIPASEWLFNWASVGTKVVTHY